MEKGKGRVGKRESKVSLRGEIEQKCQASIWKNTIDWATDSNAQPPLAYPDIVNLSFLD